MLDVLENEVYTRISDILWSGWDESRIENAVDCTGIITDAQLQQWREDQEQLELDTMREVINEHYPAAQENPVIHTFFEDYWKLKRQYENETTNQGLQILEMESRLKRSAQANKGLSLQIQGLQYQIAGLQSVGDADTIGLFPAMPGAYLENSISSVMDISEGERNDMSIERRRVQIATNDDGSPIYKQIKASGQNEMNDRIVQTYIESGRIWEFMERQNGDNVHSQETFGEYAKKWMDVYKKPSLKPGAIAAYETRLKAQILPAFEKKCFHEITAETIQQFLNERKEHAAKYLKELRALISQILDSAVEDGIISSNPAKSKRIVIPSKKKTERKPLPLEQFKSILSEIDNLQFKDQCFIVLLMFTGMRRGEMLGLQWGDIDTKQNLIHIVRSVSHAGGNQPIVDTTKTESGVRDVPLDSYLLKVLSPERRTGYILGGEKTANNDNVQ